MRRTFTAAEADRLLPRVEEALGRIRGAMEELRHVRDQLQDLRIIWGERIESSECPDRPEYESYLERFREAERLLAQEVAGMQELGVEIKDPDAGLVDFYTELDGQPVYLCWKHGEPRVQFWHTLSSGFAGRKPLS